ncbi:MAG: hypothetical protein BWX88_04220 [Planctomycetes bacterium ADurb.Bin126]|nr:MAG: hypothetical protein BWX88_04220 [Planctomycetes bacterium ADurb.Bin126]HOD84208.1 PEP-CTERM sorting domain-containing protein [Phycisphaerae bacterium]HQL74982.1 PEP-CTERM sorting domain-containing protein [Phycisphaerae bacterium]
MNDIRTLTLSLTLAVALPAGGLFAGLAEPTADADFRDLRSDYVKTWYIYADTNSNGILDPGDRKVDAFKNWWTPVSAHTQHNYEDGPYGAEGFTYAPGQDLTSAPMNFASRTDAADNFWLAREKNAIHFYMSYSQFDNNDFSTFYANLNDADRQKFLSDHNLNRNGWSLGWVTHDVTKDAQGAFVNDQTQAGKVKMDVYVHNGQGTYDIAGFGTSRSNPEVATSNDINFAALDQTQWHPPVFAGGTYDINDPANQAYKNMLGLSDSQFQQILDSMETREIDPSILGNQAIWANRTPAEIEAALTDHAGNAYLYQDAFLERSTYVEGATDGAVIAGLAGQSNYDPSLNNWGDQQVIRIDIAPETLMGEGEDAGNIRRIAFYDFGDSMPGAEGTQQTDPRAILLDLSDANAFPEYRFFIAQVEIPEPTTMALLIGGGTLLLARRRRRRQPAKS